MINGQHAAKKPRLTNQLPDISLEALKPLGPVPSPAASQMSNMANPTKVIKFTTRGRKSKGLKVFIYFGNLHPGHVKINWLHITLQCNLSENMHCSFKKKLSTPSVLLKASLQHLNCKLNADGKIPAYPY